MGRKPYGSKVHTKVGYTIEICYTQILEEKLAISHKTLEAKLLNM
jgi:hypothetical protein